MTIGRVKSKDARNGTPVAMKKAGENSPACFVRGRAGSNGELASSRGHGSNGTAGIFFALRYRAMPRVGICFPTTPKHSIAVRKSFVNPLRAGFLLLVLVSALLSVQSAFAQEPTTSDTGAQEAPTDPNQIQPPQLLNEITTTFPESEMSDDATSVDVPLLITIDEDGIVSEIQALADVAPAFVTAASEAIGQAQFEPARMGDGTAIAVQIEVVIALTPPERIVQAVTSVVQGRIFSRGSKKSIPSALVVVLENDQQVIADGEGNFAFATGLTKVTLRIVAANHKPFTVVEELTPGQKVAVEYYVPPSVSDPLRITVTGQRERREVSRQTLTLKELVNVPGVGQDAIKVVQILPGVVTPSDVSGDLIVRGSDSRDNFLEIDGMQVPFVFHLLSVSSVLSSFLIEKIDFYPSNFSVRYANATGGAIIVNTRDPDQEVWRGSINIGTLQAEAYVEGPITEKLSLLVAARRSYFDFSRLRYRTILVSHLLQRRSMTITSSNLRTSRRVNIKFHS